MLIQNPAFKKGAWVFGIITIFAFQMWAAINFYDPTWNEIEDLHFTTDDAYANYINPENHSSTKTFFKTDSISIHFTYRHWGHNYIDRTYLVKIFDPNKTLVETLTFKPVERNEQFVNLTGIVLDPWTFNVTGEYTVRVSVIDVHLGWVKIVATNSKNFNLQKEVLDISAWYRDEIYLETSTTDYHHDITIFGFVEEAGENNPVASLPLDIYWLEPDGSMPVVTTVNTSMNGYTTSNITRYTTLHQDQMKLKIISRENNIYQ
ncbi:MAG: hypothetical protein ACTSU5_04230, partial [Promethearchaeota archaeon]